MIFRKYRDVSPSPPPLTYIIITTLLTAILITSPVITAFSPLPLPIVLKVELASASSSSSSENGGDEESNTDATTTDDTEGQHQQVPPPQQHQQVPPPQQHQQVPGTTTSPHSGSGTTTTTTPLIPDDDSIEIPSTGTTTIDETPPDSEDTPSDTTSPQSPPTDTSSQQGGQQPSSGLPTPFNAVPPQSPPSTTTSQGEGQQQGQGQQQQPPQQQVPGTTSPDSTGRTITFPGLISITKGPDSGVSAIIPDSGVTISSGPNGVHTVVLGNAQLSRGSDGSVNLKLPNAEHISLSPDGIGQISLGDTKITGNRDSTLTIEKPYVDPRVSVTGARITNTYSLDGNVATKNPDDSTTSAKIGSVDGGTTIFPEGISIRKDSDGRVSATIPDKDSKEVTISFSPNGGVDSISHWDDDRESQDSLGRGSDGSVKVSLDDDSRLSLSPDGIGQIIDDDDETTITGNRDGSLTIEKPYVDPNTRARGASITTTYKAPAYP